MTNYSKVFSTEVVKTLKAFGIKITGATFTNGEMNYTVDDNGISKTLTYKQIVKMGTR